MALICVIDGEVHEAIVIVTASFRKQYGEEVRLPDKVVFRCKKCLIKMEIPTDE